MKKLQIILLAILLFNVLPLSSQINVNQLKSAYIEKFTRFIEWPSVEKQDSTAFVIGYFLDNDFISIFKNFLATTKVCNRSVKFKKINNIYDAEGCDLVYIPDFSKTKVEKIVNFCSEKPILLISHSENFARYGIHLNFYVSGNNLRFEANPEAIKNSGLKASYHLLKLSKIINFAG